MAHAIGRARFISRVFTDAERGYAAARGNQAEVFAGMFAAKEAVAKALGSGFSGFGLHDVEILHDAAHAPYAALYNGAREALSARGASRVYISISHDRRTAVAVAVIEGDA